MSKFGGIELDEKFGGYKIVNLPADKLPQDLASAIKVVNEKLGATFIPIWYYGSQPVNGTNHLIICKEIRSTKNKNVSIVGVVIRIPAGSVGGEGAEVVEIIEEAKLTSEIEVVFKNTDKQYTGMGFKPIVYVGSQTVKGKNYIFICQAKEINVDSAPFAVVLVVNVFENNYVIKGVVPITGDSENTICGYAFTW